MKILNQKSEIPQEKKKLEKEKWGKFLKMKARH